MCSSSRPDGGTLALDDAHHHDQAPGHEQHFHDARGVNCFLLDPLSYGFMQRGLVAALMVGIVCAVMGTFVVLKGLAFIGDAVSHAAFPGSGRSRTSSASRSTSAVRSLRSARRSPSAWCRPPERFASTPPWASCSLARSRSAWLLYSTIHGYVTDLMGYLLGNVLASPADLVQVALLGAAVLVSVALLRKELLYATFDPRVRPRRACPWAPRVPVAGAPRRDHRGGHPGGGIILVVAMLVTPAATRSSW